MGLFNLFTKKKTAIKTNQDFWDWFQTRQQAFYSIVKAKGDIQNLFFNELGPKLDELRPGFFFLTGMLNADTVELIITVDGIIKNIAFAEELVAAAPQIKGWKFTALKPASDIKNTAINMAGYKFDGGNLCFYSNNVAAYPDYIDITIVYDGYKEADRQKIMQGVYIFLDNFLGELEFVTTIDNINIIGRGDETAELVPIEKLPSFINWREKEFVEKYHGTRRDTASDNYSILEATLKNGRPLIAVINTDLLKWDAKASHPWILNVQIKYDGENSNGMPDQNTSSLSLEIEDSLVAELKDVDGFLNVGRETAEGCRDIYFACKDFRKAAKISEQLKLSYSDRIALDYEIYKDKYWRSLDRFTAA